MSALDVIVLSVVQGVTEFLPISSSGHLVAVRTLFGIADIEGNLFDAFLHLGTLAAVLFYFRAVWWGIARGLIRNDQEGQDKRELAAKLALATVPAAVAGYFFQDAVGEVFRNLQVVAIGLLVTAAILLIAEFVSRRAVSQARASFYDAFLIGVAQIIALVPGISRSGVTIAAGQARGLNRQQATSFSFLMSAPIIAGAGLNSVGSLLTDGAYSWSALLLGFGLSFVSGLAAISILLKFVARMSWLSFVAYLIVVGGILWYVG